MAQELTPVLYNKALLIIAELHKTDEVKEWINQAAAYQEYARQAQDDTLERQAKEIRVRAQHRMGELLQTKERNDKGRPTKLIVPPAGQLPDMVVSDTTKSSVPPMEPNSKSLYQQTTLPKELKEWEDYIIFLKNHEIQLVSFIRRFSEKESAS